MTGPIFYIVTGGVAAGSGAVLRENLGAQRVGVWSAGAGRSTDDLGVITSGEATADMIEKGPSGSTVMVECPLCGEELDHTRVRHFENEHTADDLTAP